MNKSDKPIKMKALFKEMTMEKRKRAAIRAKELVEQLKPEMATYINNEKHNKTSWFC